MNAGAERGNIIFNLGIPARGLGYESGERVRRNQRIFEWICKIKWRANIKIHKNDKSRVSYNESRIFRS